VNESPDIPDTERGLYPKFNVERVNGSARHQHCFYFVLDLRHDPHARAAAEAYVLSCENQYPVLAAELRTKISAEAFRGMKEEEFNND